MGTPGHGARFAQPPDVSRTHPDAPHLGASAGGFHSLYTHRVQTDDDGELLLCSVIRMLDPAVLQGVGLRGDYFFDAFISLDRLQHFDLKLVPNVCGNFTLILKLPQTELASDNNGQQ